MLKVCKGSFALMCRHAAVMWNVKMYLNCKGQATSYFKYSPPTIEEYLASLNNSEYTHHCETLLQYLCHRSKCNKYTGVLFNLCASFVLYSIRFLSRFILFSSNVIRLSRSAYCLSSHRRFCVSEHCFAISAPFSKTRRASSSLLHFSWASTLDSICLLIHCRFSSSEFSYSIRCKSRLLDELDVNVCHERSFTSSISVLDDQHTVQIQHIALPLPIDFCWLPETVCTARLVRVTRNRNSLSALPAALIRHPP